MDLKLHDSSKKLKVAETTFGREYNEALVHQAVNAWLAGARSGTRAQKNRSDVRGGGAKPWRQKGTGRARAGTIRSPLWTKGGVTFAARPQDHSQRLNRKMYRNALRSILSELVRQDRLIIVGDLGISEPKTSAMIERLEALGGADALIVMAEIDSNVALSSRNIPHVDTVTVHEINPVNLLRHERVIMTADAVAKIEEWLA